MILLEGLGKCEHCGRVLSIEGMPGESIDAVWSCPTCKKELTHKSFGYERVMGQLERVKWVNKNKRWTRKRPTSDFFLDGSLVVLNLPRSLPHY